MERPKEGCTDKEFSKWLWSDYSEHCKKCKNKCKQSHIAKQIVCPRFEKKGE